MHDRLWTISIDDVPLLLLLLLLYLYEIYTNQHAAIVPEYKCAVPNIIWLLTWAVPTDNCSIISKEIFGMRC